MNEYLEEFSKYVPDYNVPWFDRKVRYHDIVESYEGRRNLTRKYSWAVPTDIALDCIAKYSPIVEIGAGTGYWASLLRERGVTIHAYDRFPPDGSDWTEEESQDGVGVGKNWYHRGEHLHTEVVQGTQHVLKEYDPSWNLFLCWPPMSGMAHSALDLFRGQYVIYIGETEWGCNANDGFFSRLHSAWNEVESVDLPQWEGLHDNLWVYERR